MIQKEVECSLKILVMAGPMNPKIGNNANLTGKLIPYFLAAGNEGLILGKPIVTTDCTGMRELLGDSEFGMITAMDEDSLFQGVKTMLCDESLRLSYREKAAERGNDFSAEKLTKETEEHFVKLAGN